MEKNVRFVLENKRIITEGWPEGIYAGILQDICIAPDDSIFIISNYHETPGYVLDKNLNEITPLMQRCVFPLNIPSQRDAGRSGKQTNPHCICVNDMEIFIGGSHEMGRYGEISKYNRATGTLSERIMMPSVDDLETIDNYLYAVLSNHGQSETVLAKLSLSACNSACNSYNGEKPELIARDIGRITKQGQKIYGLQGFCKNSIVSYKIIEISNGNIEKEFWLECQFSSGFNRRWLEVDAAGNILLLEQSGEKEHDKVLWIFSPDGKYIAKKEVNEETPFGLFKFNNQGKLVNITMRGYTRVETKKITQKKVFEQKSYKRSLDARIFGYYLEPFSNKMLSLIEAL